MRGLIICIILLSGWVNDARARIYYLPDYQNGFIFGSRDEDSDSGPHTSTPSCSTYGYYSTPQTNADCTRHLLAPGLYCYRCSCSSRYKYSRTVRPYCLSPKELAGGSCGGKWSQCLCPASVFPYTAKNCSYDLGGGTCSDENGMHYSACNNPCDNISEVTPEEIIVYCPAGNGYAAGYCASYSKACPAKCVRAWPHCCHIRTDNKTDLGCEKYWDDCPRRCEVGKTCSPKDCSSYPLGTAPANASYETCTPGCGDNTPRYKLTSCNEGYYLSGQGCLPKSCPVGSAFNLAGCGEETFEYGWELGTKVAQIGDKSCYQCDMICLEYGYELNSNKTECVVRPCPSGYAVNAQKCGTMSYGSYTLKSNDYSGGWSDNERCLRCQANCYSGYKQTLSECGTIANGNYRLQETGEICKKCVLSCNSGYKISGSKCVQDCTPNDCSRYTLFSEADPKAEYASCTPGCGNNTTKYMFRSCISGYNQESGVCVPTDVCAKAAFKAGFKPEYAEMTSVVCGSYMNTYPLCFTIQSGVGKTQHCGWTFPDNQTQAYCVGSEREVKISSTIMQTANKNPDWVLKNIYQNKDAFPGQTPSSGATIRRIQTMSGNIRFCVTQ